MVRLLDFRRFVHAWRADRVDGLVGVLTFAGTLAFAPELEWGIAIGVTLSPLAAYLYRTMRPTVVELAPHPDGALRDARRYQLPTCRHLAVISFEGPLNFASVAYLEERDSGPHRGQAGPAALAHLRPRHQRDRRVEGEETLRRIVENLRASGYQKSPSRNCRTPSSDVLRRSGLYEQVGAPRFFATRALALSEIYADAHQESSEPDCPFQQAMPPVVELSLHPDGSLRTADRHGLAMRCRPHRRVPLRCTPELRQHRVPSTTDSHPCRRPSRPASRAPRYPRGQRRR